MKVGLIDVDSHNYPNLPLMKISAWHKHQGDQVERYNPWVGITEPYDKVYVSKVFSFTPDYQAPIYAKEVQRGGTGYAISLENGKEVYRKERDPNLQSEIEHAYPDYDLYPRFTDTSYGFLTRGCPRNCGFCIVGKKEGASHKVANLDEFWAGQKKIALSDPNILACKDHKELLQQLIDSKAIVEFSQGLDIRLVTDSNLDLLRQVRLKEIHFAFDRWQDRDAIIPKLKAFKDATGYDRNKGRVLVYILVNYDTTLEQDIERIQLCRELNFAPYVMIYDKANCDPVYKSLQRWANNYYVFWTVPTFEEYKRR